MMSSFASDRNGIVIHEKVKKNQDDARNIYFINRSKCIYRLTDTPNESETCRAGFYLYHIASQSSNACAD